MNEQLGQVAISEGRQKQINQIITHDRQAYLKSMASLAFTRRLDLPDDALRYLLIPQRILELSTNPERVKIWPLIVKPDEISALIIEPLDKPITDKQVLDRYTKERERKAKKHLLIPDIPEGVDRFHVLYQHFLSDGSLSLNDRVMLEVHLKKGREDELHVVTYLDREENLHKGVAKGFYGRLRDIAKQLSFRFITGQNSTRNISFFKRIGRATLDKVDPSFWKEIIGDISNIEPETYSIDFLNEKDKDKYIKS